MVRRWGMGGRSLLWSLSMRALVDCRTGDMAESPLGILAWSIGVLGSSCVLVVVVAVVVHCDGGGWRRVEGCN